MYPTFKNFDLDSNSPNDYRVALPSNMAVAIAKEHRETRDFVIGRESGFHFVRDLKKF